MRRGVRLALLGLVALAAGVVLLGFVVAAVEDATGRIALVDAVLASLLRLKHVHMLARIAVDLVLVLALIGALLYAILELADMADFLSSPFRRAGR